MSMITPSRADYQHDVCMLRSVIIIFFLTISTLPSLHCVYETKNCEFSFSECDYKSYGGTLNPRYLLPPIHPRLLCAACRDSARAIECFTQNRRYCNDEDFESNLKYWKTSFTLACSYLKDIDTGRPTNIYKKGRCFSQEKNSQCKQKYESSTFGCKDIESFLDCSMVAAEGCGSTNKRLFAAGLYHNFQYLTEYKFLDSEGTKQKCLEKLSRYEMLPNVTFDRDAYCRPFYEDDSPASMIVGSRIWSLLGSFLVIIGCKLRFICYT